MKFLSLILIALLSSASSYAEDIRCLIIPSENTKIEGMQHYTMFKVDLDVKDQTKVAQVTVDSLFENGFYGTFPLNLVSGEFIERQYVTFTYVSAGDEVSHISVFATYDVEKKNYQSTIFDGREVEIRCMKLVGL